VLDRLKEYITKWVAFIPIIHRFRTWDYGFYLELNIAALKLMEQSIFVNGHHKYTKRQHRDIKIAIEALNRLSKNKYHKPTESLIEFSLPTKENNKFQWSVQNKSLYKHRIEIANIQLKQDLRLFTSILNKRITYWWD